MKAEIVCIGDEILIGQIVNTNSVWIAQQLNLNGISVIHMSTVGDTAAEILDALRISGERADLVFITGGLGPTKDDITKKCFADFFKAPLTQNADVLNDVTRFFQVRGKEMTDLNRDQALVPLGCEVIRNSNGTAPGMWMQNNNTVYVSMPGVPYEMKAMFTVSVLPMIRTRFNLPFICHKTILTQGIGESALAEILREWEEGLNRTELKLAYLPQPGIVRLRISGTSNNREELERLIEQETKKLHSLIGNFIFGTEEFGKETPKLEEMIFALLKQEGKTLSLAESCTGGHISSLITAIPGASEIYKGGVIPYSNVAKQELVRVNSEVFEVHGAVSRSCVEQLAQNTLLLFHSDYSLAISGIAGPSGGSEQKPVGLVWVAVANKDRVCSKEFRFGDNRQRNIVMAAQSALNFLRKFLIEESSFNT